MTAPCNEDRAAYLAHSGEPLHYTECGLPNVWLRNGFVWRDTPYGRAVSIMDMDGLHRALARRLVESGHPLSGRELKFLRQEIDCTQGALAVELGVSEQTVSSWERGNVASVPPPSARLLRLVVEKWLNGAVSLSDAMERIKAEQTEAAPDENESLSFLWSSQAADRWLHSAKSV